MKKLFLLALAIAIAPFAVPVFAGENWNGNRQMAVTLSVRTLFILDAGFDVNLGFEYAPIPDASVTADFGYTFFIGHGFGDFPPMRSLEQSRFHARLGGRWYPPRKYVHGYFLGGFLQFMHDAGSYLEPDEQEKWIRIEWRDSIFSIFTDTGYKAIVDSDKRAAFAIEPTLGFGFPLAALGSDSASDSDDRDLSENYWERSWEGWFYGTSGLFLRLPMGVAF